MTDCGCWGLVMSDSGCFWLFVADWLFVTVFWVFSVCSGSIFGYFLVSLECLWVSRGCFLEFSGVF